jgi:hypothetical protein
MAHVKSIRHPSPPAKARESGSPEPAPRLNRGSPLRPGPAFSCCSSTSRKFFAGQLEALSKIRAMFGLPGDSAVVINASTKDPGLDWNYYREYYGGQAWWATFSAEDLGFCATAIDWDLATRFGCERIASNSAQSNPVETRAT